jgi:hypothetical protein
LAFHDTIVKRLDGFTFTELLTEEAHDRPGMGGEGNDDDDDDDGGTTELLADGARDRPEG